MLCNQQSWTTCWIAVIISSTRYRVSTNVRVGTETHWFHVSKDSKDELTWFLSEWLSGQEKQAWQQKSPSLELVEFRAVLHWGNFPFYARPLDLIFHSWEPIISTGLISKASGGKTTQRKRRNTACTAKLFTCIDSLYPTQLIPFPLVTSDKFAKLRCGHQVSNQACGSKVPFLSAGWAQMIKRSQFDPVFQLLDRYGSENAYWQLLLQVRPKTPQLKTPRPPRWTHSTTRVSFLFHSQMMRAIKDCESYYRTLISVVITL